MKKIFKKKNRGFTIVEMIVSIGLFITVSLISVGALLSIVGVNKKTQSTESVMNNLGFALESISKTMRVGSNYHCEDVIGEVVPPNLDTPRDCASGGNLLAYERSNGDPDDSSDQVVLRLNGNKIEKSVDGGSTFINLTAPEVVINSTDGFRVYVIGSTLGDNLQPKAIILIGGVVSFGEKATTEFNLQTTISQREVDS